MTRSEAVHLAIDMATSSRAIETLDAETLSQVSMLIEDHAIEITERISDHPGVSGNPGASPKQRAVQDAFFSGDYRIVAASGANQSGKTEAIGGQCFCKHLRDRARDGDQYWVIAQSSETVRDIPQKTLWKFLPRRMFPQSLTYAPRHGFGTISTLNLNLDSGGQCEVWFKNEEQDLMKFESSRLNGVWWSECQREALFDALIPRLLRHRGWMLMDYVPLKAWQKYRIRLGDKKLIYHQRFGMIDNAHNLPENAISEARSTMSAKDARIRIDGEEGSSFGVVYQEFEPERHTCQRFQIGGEVNKALYRCYDYGYRNPSTCLWASVLPSGYRFPEVGSVWGGRELDREVLLVYREYYQAGQTIQAQAASIKQMSGQERYRFDGRMVVDPSIFNRTQVSGPKVRTIAQLLAENGVDCKRGRRGKGDDMHSQIAKVRSWFEQDKIIFMDTCPNAIREHESWRYKEDKEGHAPGNEPPMDADDHTCDALRYLVAENLTHATTQVEIYHVAA